MNEDTRYGEARGMGMGMSSSFLIGALVGAGIALLLAPAPGSDTRRRLGSVANRASGAARDAVHKAKDTFGRMRHDVDNAREDMENEVARQVGEGGEPRL